MLCPRCKIDKPVTEFGTNRTRKTGKNSYCKLCMESYLRTWASAHPPRIKAIGATRRATHKGVIKTQHAAYRTSHRERLRARLAAWELAHPGNKRSRVALRRCLATRAIPAWSDPKKITEIYLAREAAEELFGIKVHVDHIVPVRSKHVCGLHVAANLRLLPAGSNIRKGNRWWPDMWEAA